MNAVLYLAILGFLKIIDNALSTAKTIFVQNNRSVLAAIALTLSNFIYFYITKDVVASDDITSLVVVSVASGIGCWLAIAFNDKFSKDKTYVNVIMSDDIVAMQKLRSFLARHKITNVATESYTLDWEKTLCITAYAETKEQSRLIDEYLNNSATKFKRVVQGERIKR